MASSGQLPMQAIQWVHWLLQTGFLLVSLILLMVSVPGENKTSVRSEDTYVEMLSEMNLTQETYYAAEKNICIIHIP